MCIDVRRYRNHPKSLRVESQLLQDSGTIPYECCFDGYPRKVTAALKPQRRQQWAGWHILLPLRFLEVLQQEVFSDQARLVAGASGGYERIEQVKLYCISNLVACAGRERES